MASKKLKIAFIASEMAPFSKSGGLGDVIGCLPDAILSLGQKVIVITPLYEQTIDKEYWKLQLIFENVEVYLNEEEKINISCWQGKTASGLSVYFIQNTKYFSKKKSLYGSEHENARFFVFDVAALKLLSLLKFKADIIHCHDWHAGLIPYFLKTDFRYSETLKNAQTIFTIHNLAFQFGHDWWNVPQEKKDDGHYKLPKISNPEIENINFVRRAILHADAINTVSETYCEEIMTKEFGEDQDKILANRVDRLFGIINGIDEGAWDPKTDPGLYKMYDSAGIYLKDENKKYFQKKFGLAVNSEIPILCSTNRMTYQKGFDLILNVLEHILAMNIQVVLAGACPVEYLSRLKKIVKRHPKKIVLLPNHEELLQYETLIYAASDFFMLPSYYEPCGLTQLRAMRYGCVPIVRKVGGLSDTVEDYHRATGRGSGFVFEKFDEFQLFGAIVRAMENYLSHDKWKKLATKIMNESHSWDIPAKKYLKLYRRVIKWDEKNKK